MVHHGIGFFGAPFIGMCRREINKAGPLSERFLQTKAQKTAQRGTSELSDRFFGRSSAKGKATVEKADEFIGFEVFLCIPKTLKTIQKQSKQLQKPSNFITPFTDLLKKKLKTIKNIEGPLFFDSYISF